MQKRRLEDHFKNDMAALDIDPARLPPNLFFTYSGDILGSSGEHYAKGKPIELHDAAAKANAHYSDDFAESLAMHLLSGRRWNTDLKSLMDGRDEFLNIIRGHYIAYGLQYSPWAAALFEEKVLSRYGVLLARHDGCGAPMRAAALAPHEDINTQNLLPFFLITHANAQAIEGAYMVWAFARGALKGESYDTCASLAREIGIEGREMARRFLKEQSLQVVTDIGVVDCCDNVLKTRDPYINVKDISKEGVDTHFVVSSAFLILEEIQSGKAKSGAEAAYVIERGLEIGGDPDTICSVTMGLAGLLSPESFRRQLADIEIRVQT